MQAPQAMHLLSYIMSSGLVLIDSGLWHHLHRSLQPFRKMVVRMPGPSCTANRFMSKIKPSGSGDLCDVAVLDDVFCFISQTMAYSSDKLILFFFR